MTGLRAFVVEQFDRDTWKTFKRRAGVDRPTYSRVEDYPDEEFRAVYGAILEAVDADDRQLQRAFGASLFDELADIYGSVYFDDDWGALDLLENVEGTIHQSLKRRDDATFTPPELAASRTAADRVRIEYGSDRQLCDLGKGLIDGVETYYGTPLEVDEPQCMRDGAPVCEIEVTRPSGRA